ncbi:PREDICTED: D-tyrosyl-tRNA(Tyr) deacylase-like isoform X2 [Camelina sativa]|uniref:D-aminoacyl-tRNA deacylase n=1 Tax=Camelina sativa TaxID=90675 RepID=A0ABM1QJ22_CAMSA|nr:PREDICTED: D-tyrosyl-tRNA(Tyr) deacylase-like isoform X2 [Camelina sativa]
MNCLAASVFPSSHTTLLLNKLSPLLLRRNRRHQSQRLHRRNYQIRAMRAVVQRVSSSSVTVDGRIVSEIGPGLLVLIGIHESDTDSDADYICRKVVNMRLFTNETAGKGWDQNVMQRNYEVLLVSQFTFYGFLKGNKPDFHVAMPPDKAKPFYASLVEKFQKAYNPDAVKDGVFGAMMQSCKRRSSHDAARLTSIFQE